MRLSFHPLSLDLQGDYLQRLRASQTNASDYSFANIWGWAEEYGLLWAWDTDLVWLKQTVPMEQYWAPMGPWEKIDWAGLLPRLLPSGSRIIRVPEALRNLWLGAIGDRILLDESRGHWDYLYNVGELIELRGNRYHKKKNLLTQFRTKYEYRFASMSPEIIRMALEMQEEWCLWRDCESSETLSAENRAISRVFTDWDRLQGLSGGALLVEEALAGYTIAEAMTADTLVIHFEKGCTGYKGIYQAIQQIFLEHSAGDFATVNREQDLDDPGLRKAKMSYHPTGFVKKFTARLK